MTSYSELNDIALVMLQVTGLLLPVVFLTVNFAKKEAWGRLAERERELVAKLLLVMISSLTITGLMGAIGVLELPIKTLVLVISVCSLALFFVFYGYFIYVISPY